MSGRKHIALLIETSREHGRQMLAGISRFAAQVENWSLRLEPRNIDDPAPKWLQDWAGDGIIARCDSSELTKALVSTGLPCVDVRGGGRSLGMPFVGINSDAIIDTAIDHFRIRGFQHFAYCSRSRSQHFWMQQRRDYYQSQLSGMGYQVSCFPSKESQRRLKDEQKRLSEWLLQLPRPVAILACDDEQAHQLVNLAEELHIRIPQEIAVLGIDNDQVFCRIPRIPISSVDVNASEAGFKAAQVLAQLMAGKSVPQQTLVQPRGVITRQSTEVIAVDCEETKAALHYINSHACEGITADDVAKHAAISRSTLDRYLRRAINQSATAVILEAKLNAVKKCLTNTELPLASIARQTGFVSVHHLANLFRKQTGVPPGQFRRETTRDKSI
ncbi:XylR family transcriptional regulator [Calycomorphotria hydatis]|uniref:Xylose operon regulatory protein n=1 Tax=Calycomorphotria hydatis TaxID=2528027 RepID=A0A517TD95_9PLAN|nr:DNA-binding transcriptional regulator [Calycomorphotria hydatis]QDT66342.1 Xylose operon regulatory protein [Calycomorphotria hydatis]